MKNSFSMIPAILLWIVVLSSPVVVAQQESGGLHTVDARTPQGLQALFTPNGDALPLVSAHRGGAAIDFPENCIATFEHTLRRTWSMLEIDLRYTKDGVLVLNHDPTLDRTTSSTGRVEDFTLEELKQCHLKDRKGNLTKYRITTLGEALTWARGKAILVLDKKDVPVKNVVREIETHRAEAYAMVMAYSFEEIKECHALNKDIMMEIMVGSSERFDAFDKTGVPWHNVIVFVGHIPPQDAGLCDRIHTRGASCMAGSSRNIDLQFLSGIIADMKAIEPDYRALLGLGVDVIETDIPTEVGPLLYGGRPIPASRSRYFRYASR